MNRIFLMLALLFSVLSFAQTGINTTTPTETLDVNGTARVRVVSPMVNLATSDSLMVLNSSGVVMRIPAKQVVIKGLADGAALTPGASAVLTDGTVIVGDGTTGDEIKLGQQGAILGDVLVWNGTSWLPEEIISLSDDVSITGDGSASEPFKVKDLGITTAKLAAAAVDKTKIAADVAGTGLNQNTDGSLEVDGTDITGDGNITSDDLTVGGDANALLANVTLEIAAGKVGTTELADDAVTTVKIVDANVTNAKLAADAVTNAKLADNAVQTENIVNGTIITEDLADNSVTTAKIIDANVTTAKLAAAAVDKTKIAADVAGTGLNQNADGSLEVDGTDITGDGNITSDDLTVGGDENALLANVTLEIAAGKVGTTELADDAVTNAKLADNAVQTENIVNGTIITEDLADNSVTTGKIINGTIISQDLATDSVTTTKIEDNAVTLAKIENGSTTGQIMRWDGTDWVLVLNSSLAIAGDVTGTLATSKVEKIQNVAVSATAPTDGQILTYNNANSQWEATSVSGSGILSLNGISNANQTFAVGTTGTDVNIASTGSTHTINVPDASATNRGAVTTGAQTFTGNKTFNNNVSVNGTFTLGSTGSAMTTMIKGTATITYADFTRNSGSTVFVPVSGAQVGDHVIVNPTAAVDPLVLIGHCYISSANILKIGLGSGANNIDAGSITLNVLIIR